VRGLVVIVVAWVAASARADIPPLSTERAELLDQHATVALAEGMSITQRGTAVLDWGSVRFTLVAGLAELARDGERRALVGLGGVHVERIALAHSGVGYGATVVLPRAVGDRVLIYVASGVAPNGGQVAVLRFYVSANGLDDAGAWAKLARAIAATLELHVDPPPALLPLMQPVPPHIGTCDLRDSVLDVTPSAPPTAAHVPATLRGELAYWSVWSDRAGRHAEILIGAARWGMLHIECRAGTAAALVRYQARVEILLR
jgi:hypothetical protein